MLKYNFKDRYYNYVGDNLQEKYITTLTYYSPLVQSGNGTRENPYRSTNLNSLYLQQDNSALILSQGIHRVSTTIVQPAQRNKYINGSGIDSTFISFDNYTISYQSLTAFKDLTFLESVIKLSGLLSLSIRFDNCCIAEQLTFNTGGGNLIIAKCKIYSLPVGITLNVQNNNSFINVSTTIGLQAGSLHTFDNCNLIINQSSLTNFYNNHYVFDNCNFRIGSETEYTPLTAATPDDRRVEFLARCTAAGLTPPAETTEYGLTSSIPRWLFTSNQIFDGITWLGSDINLFEVPRLISFGYNESRGKKIPITGKVSTKESFNPSTPHSVTGLDITEDSLSIDPTIDITQRNNLYIDSNIIWLGGKKKVTKLDLPNNLPAKYGVNIDSIPNLLCDAGQEITSGNIVEGEMYMVRSSGVDIATITYNGVTYSSSLSARNNIFKGVAGVTDFTEVLGKSAIYQLNDILAYQSMQVRIVNKIPSDIITTGKLTENYWYLVEHDTDQSNTTDFVTLDNGNTYYVGDSFISDGMGITSITGTVHLRRCWDQNFDYSIESLDAAFWQNEQKPEWCDVLPEDTRCLMKNNHVRSVEMIRGDDGKYITTGHPEYYNLVLGTSGVQLPNDIYMSGTYMQIRLPITTVNPM